jgi:hypothetical protein
MTERPSTTLPGTVEKIIKSPDPGEPEKVQIAVQGADDLYREIRIENTLTKESGEEVSQKKGAEVEVTASRRKRPNECQKEGAGNTQTDHGQYGPP